MKKTLSTVLISIVVFSTLSIFMIQSSRSVAENPYRKKIIVDNSGNPETLTNYQVFINITYDSNMQADFDDLRFTWYNETSGEEVDVDYWLDKYMDSEYALVWVEVPEIRGAGQEVLYMYYGDPDAVSESNGEETFVFFDGFSTDTTANYELWSPTWPLPSGNPYNEFSWDPNGWLFVDASDSELPGHRNSNVHVTHKTAQIDTTEEKYWLETRGKAFGTGALDYFGVGKAYKHGSVPDDNYELFCLVRRSDPAPAMNKTCIQSLWGSSWEFFECEDVSVPTKDEWYRFGVGTSPSGTVIGRFYDDDYNEIETIVDHTIHQDNEWWVDLLVSRKCDTWATMHAYFDYVRVRKFTDPEPSACMHEGLELYIRRRGAHGTSGVWPEWHVGLSAWTQTLYCTIMNYGEIGAWVEVEFVVHNDLDGIERYRSNQAWVEAATWVDDDIVPAEVTVTASFTPGIVGKYWVSGILYFKTGCMINKVPYYLVEDDLGGEGLSRDTNVGFKVQEQL